MPKSRPQYGPKAALERRKLSKNPVWRFEELRRRYQNIKANHKEEMYDLYQDIAVECVIVANSPRDLNKFIEIGAIKPRKGISPLQALVKFAITKNAARSNSQGDKVARSIRHLIEEEGVAADKIGKELHRRGGLDKVYKSSKSDTELDADEMPSASVSAPNVVAKSHVSSKSTKASAPAPALTDCDHEDEGGEEEERSNAEIKNSLSEFSVEISSEMENKYEKAFVLLQNGESSRITGYLKGEIFIVTKISIPK